MEEGKEGEVRKEVGRDEGWYSGRREGGGEKAFSVVANWQQSDKVEHGCSARLQTFPYPTASKSFLYSNAFMAFSF